MIASPTVRHSVTDEGIVVLMDVSSGKIFYANSIGARVWLGINHGLPMATIIDEISMEFKVSREQVDSDIRLYLESLKAAGLVTENNV